MGGFIGFVCRLQLCVWRANMFVTKLRNFFVESATEICWWNKATEF